MSLLNNLCQLIVADALQHMADQLNQHVNLTASQLQLVLPLGQPLDPIDWQLPEGSLGCTMEKR